jgi:hypothetical protein
MASAGAQALPVPPSLGAAPLLEHVAEGCGRGFYRNARGVCRPMRGFRRGPVVRRCVVRITRFGRERICRVRR